MILISYFNYCANSINRNCYKSLSMLCIYQRNVKWFVQYVTTLGNLSSLCSVLIHKASSFQMSPRTTANPPCSPQLTALHPVWLTLKHLIHTYTHFIYYMYNVYITSFICPFYILRQDFSLEPTACSRASHLHFPGSWIRQRPAHPHAIYLNVDGPHFIHWASSSAPWVTFYINMISMAL